MEFMWGLHDLCSRMRQCGHSPEYDSGPFLIAPVDTFLGCPANAVGTLLVVVCAFMFPGSLRF
jgi:hypothetical protein